MFARLISEGVRKADAYRRAFGRPDVSEDAAKMGASRMLRDDIVCEKLEELEGQLDRDSVLTKQKRMKILTAEILTAHADERPAAKRIMLACIAELNKMDGAYTPARVELQGDVVRDFVLAQMDMASEEPLVRKGK